jgi:hypothetical protein
MLTPLEQPQYERLFGPIDTARTLREADWTIQRLTDLGAKPPRGCRLLRARAIVESLSQQQLPNRRGARKARLFAEAHRTLLEFHAAARSINSRLRPTRLMHRKLALAYGGKDDPVDDDDRSVVARNTQFELWLAAWFVAGRKPIRMGEPDLLAAYRFQWRGVAAKRIRSRRQIRKHVLDAAEQVKRRSGTGFIAISLDNFSHTAGLRARSSRRIGERFFQAYPEVDAAATVLVHKAPWIRALICFGHYARWVNPQNPSLQMDNLTKIVLFPEDREDSEYLRSYFDEQGKSFRSAWRR